MKEMGDLYQYNSRSEEALPVLKTALSRYKAAGKKDLYGIYDLLGIVSSNLGDYKEGIRYGLLAVANAEQLGEKGGMLCTIYNRIGNTYYCIHDFNKAIAYFDKAMDIAGNNNDINSINLIYGEKASILVYQKNYSEAKSFLDGLFKKYPDLLKMDAVTPGFFYLTIYDRLAKKEQAELYFNKLEKLLSEPTWMRPGIKLAVYEAMINYLIDVKNFKKATYYNSLYAEGMKHYDKGKNPNVYFYQFKIDSISGNYLAAIKTYQKFKRADDELTDEDTKRQINQLNILYDTEKKNRNILQLTKANELQQQTLRQAQKMRNITFIVLALVVIILLLAINGYYQKKKTNELLQKKQEIINNTNKSLQHLVDEKEWLLREIHHRVKNNLHMVAGLLASQTEFIQGEEALEAITDSQHRVQAMSIIHQKLYQTGDTFTYQYVDVYQ
ncbi:MAG: histidine kinase dimerization/phosphoacceptor domain -containing protein [Flavobacterium sp.]